MADFSALKTSIQNYIKQNGNEEITGNLLQQILLSMVTTLGDSAINDLVTALNAEIANRGNADTTLQGNINSEAAARQNADGTLQQNINNEAAARGNADTQLGNRITSEEEAREGADNTLRGLINGIKDDIKNGYVYVGIATTSTTPSTGKVFYLALTAGTYTNFGNTAVPQGINILKYNGTAWSLDSFLGLDNVPTQGSNNLVKSGGVLDSIVKDGSAFDLSAYNSGATYADLSAALTALNALPAAFKKGGMSVKFVQTSDNKYVQYRLMSTAFSTTESDWMSINIDNVPTVNSRNLVTSGSVFNSLQSINNIIGTQTKETFSKNIFTRIGVAVKGSYYSNDQCTELQAYSQYFYCETTEIQNGVTKVYANLFGGAARIACFDSEQNYIGVIKSFETSSNNKSLHQVELLNGTRYIRYTGEILYSGDLEPAGVYYKTTDTFEYSIKEQSSLSDLEITTYENMYVNTQGVIDGPIQGYTAVKIESTNIAEAVLNTFVFGSGGIVLNLCLIDENGIRVIAESASEVTSLPLTIKHGQTLLLTSKDSAPVYTFSDIKAIDPSALTGTIIENVSKNKEDIAEHEERITELESEIPSGGDTVTRSRIIKIPSIDEEFGYYLNSSLEKTAFVSDTYKISTFDLTNAISNGATQIRVRHQTGGGAFSSFYDEEENPIGTPQTYVFTGYPYYVNVEIPANAKYFKMSSDLAMGTQLGAPSISYEEVDKKVSIQTAYNEIYKDNIKIKWLENKVVMAIGESTTQGTGASMKHWYDLIEEKYNSLRFIGCGVSGTTIAYHEGSTNSIVNRLSTYLNYTNVDAYIIYAGINDFYFPSGPTPLGTINDEPTQYSEATTFMGALSFIFKSILAQNNNAKILVILPTEIDSPKTNSLNLTQQDYRDAAFKIACCYNIPVADMSHGFGISNRVGSNSYMSDGTHFNTDNGMKRAANVIENFMKAYFEQIVE